jgi:hypothetical protein
VTSGQRDAPFRTRAHRFGFPCNTFAINGSRLASVPFAIPSSSTLRLLCDSRLAEFRKSTAIISRTGTHSLHLSPHETIPGKIAAKSFGIPIA